MSEDVTKALENFIDNWVTNYQDASEPVVIQYDSKWLSPCHTDSAEENEWVDWLPVKQPIEQDFSAVESALEMTLHPDAKEYFSAFWSDNLNASTEKGNLQLLLPWNQDDFERLLQNLIGHVLMKRRLGQSETLFFAVTDEDDFILTIDNTSGKVMLEQVGLEPCEVIADNLASFIRTLTPKVI